MTPCLPRFFSKCLPIQVPNAVSLTGLRLRLQIQREYDSYNVLASVVRHPFNFYQSNQKAGVLIPAFFLVFPVAFFFWRRGQ